MKDKLVIKNHPNFLFIIIGFLALIVLSFIVLLVLFNSLLLFQDPLSLISGIFSLFPFIIFFGILLYFWLWNTFGKTEIKSGKSLIFTFKNKLFSQPKSVEFNQIKNVEFVDLTFERTKFNIRYHPFNNKAVKIHTNNESFYAVKFVNDNEAMEVINFIEDNLKKSNI